MLKTKFTRVPDVEDDGYTRVSLQFAVANGDIEKFKALGVFLAAILPDNEARQLLAEFNGEIKRRKT